ncbi:11409_t:CDS:2 [Scutellospora calospora]|uniref:11409_t:CDS:1 n=1 Tax=Scutellospora calospora TaxID=85575 RepID=A0ACA9LQV4_9GLOM|nr:11409_t:CDS:2 [Scutellospora calospora]
MCDRYSPYLICAFRATINYVKETVEEGAYGEIEKWNGNDKPGPLFKATITHTVGDAKNIQIVGDRLTLFPVSLIDKKKYLAVEMASCMIPFSFDSISYYTKILNFFAIIQTEFKEQEKLHKKIYSYIPIENTERIRDWLYLPEDYFFYDLKPIPEDIDEIIII